MNLNACLWRGELCLFKHKRVTCVLLSLHLELVNHCTILSNVSVFADINTSLLKQESIGHTSTASRFCSTRINLRDLMTAVDTKKRSHLQRRDFHRYY